MSNLSQLTRKRFSKTILCLLTCFWVNHSFSQSAKLSINDSLLLVINNEKDPKIKSEKYLLYLSKLNTEFRDSSMQLMDAAIARYHTQNFKFGEGRALSLKAWFLVFYSKYEESLKTAHKALSIQKSLSDTVGIANTLNRIGVANMQFKRYKDAENYYTQAYLRFKKLNDSTKIEMTLNNLGVLAFEQGDNPKAIKFYRQTLGIRLAQKRYGWAAFALYNIGASYLREDMLDSSEYYILKSIKTFKEKSDKKSVPAMVNLGAAELYNQKKMYIQALDYAQMGLATAEKVNHTEMILQAKELLSKILYNLNRHKEAYQMQSEFLELKTSVDSLNNASTAAEVEEKYKNAEKEAEIAKLKTKNLESENKAQLLKIYAISAVTGAIILLALILLLWQRRNQREKINLSNLNTKIAEAKMFALRAQMNPHFIFNCINTAQSFVMQNQREQANEYLSDFAKLLRLVMENSSKTYVQLDDEINQIRLYLELEAIRFERKFKYEINVDEALKEGIYEIPGMCIQPLIENAIGHGLINRNDDKGEIFIHLKLDKECIVVDITDNGVGREKASEIKASKSIRYRSAAIPNIYERLKMLKLETNQEIDLVMVDLTENDQIAGTQAILTLPWK
jgi:hypothetical protein